jgi:hypothetical protein
MDKLEYLQFSTEMPFAYLGFFTMAVLALIVGLILFGLGLRFRRWIMAVAGVGIAALVVTIIAANIVFSDHLDLNPVFSEQNIIGQWDDDDGSHLDINADHCVHFRFGPRYSGRASPATGDGTWKRSDDFEITIVPSNRSGASIPPLRVIAFNGKTHLILEDFTDTDGWDHHLGFHRVAKH